MRSSPSIALGAERDVYLVLDDFGRHGRAWRETDEGDTDRETLLRDLISGQFSDPVRIVAFNAEQHWSEDVSAEIATELRQRVGEVPEHLAEFMERHEPQGRPIQLPA